MHASLHDSWFCGPGLFSGFHGGLLHLLFWGAVLYLAYLLLRKLTSPGNRPAAADPTGQTDPLAILERRYAAGEIDQQEFLKRKNDLDL